MTETKYKLAPIPAKSVTDIIAILQNPTPLKISNSQ